MALLSDLEPAAYPIFAWIGLVALLALAYLATRVELLRTLALALATTLLILLAVAGFVLVVGL